MVGVLFLPGAIMYFIERKFNLRPRIWIIPSAMFVLGFIIWMNSIDGAGDLGAIFFVFYILWPAALSVLSGSAFRKPE